MNGIRNEINHNEGLSALAIFRHSQFGQVAASLLLGLSVITSGNSISNTDTEIMCVSVYAFDDTGVARIALSNGKQVGTSTFVPEDDSLYGIGIANSGLTICEQR